MTTSIRAMVSAAKGNFIRSGTSGPAVPGLLVLTGIDGGEIVALDRSPVIIGSGAQADVSVLDHRIEDEHLRLVVSDDQVTIESAGGPGTVLLNGGAVLQRTPLADGDQISIGRHAVFKFLAKGNAGRAPPSRTPRTFEGEGRRLWPLTASFPLNRLEIEARWSAEAGSSVALLVLGIDRVGELVAPGGLTDLEAVCGEVAKVLHGALRAHDLLSRHDRSRFIVLCRDAALAQGRLIAERLRSRVESQSIRAPGVEIVVSLSAGVATSDGSRDFRELLVAADLAMFEAQIAGGNRVIDEGSIEPTVPI